jgi:hypothetical protein
MLADKVVIQKIEPGGVRLYQSFKLVGGWGVETNRDMASSDPHKEVFPFILDARVHLYTAWAGSETHSSIREGKEALFVDDYSLPAGLVVGILFPRNYVPSIFKFRELAAIPLGSAHSTSPGYVSTYHNSHCRTSAVTFFITQVTRFRFKCVSTFTSGAYPIGEDGFAEEFLASLGLRQYPDVVVTREDIEQFKPALRQDADLGALVNAINELIFAYKKSAKAIETQNARVALMDRAERALAAGASVTTILDSCAQGGAAHQLISRLLTFVGL